MENTGILFGELIFGPVASRRLGTSLGINLLPVKGKLCNFDCIYCECGWTNLRALDVVQMPDRKSIREALQCSMVRLSVKGTRLDSLTFAGNGEPTLHPRFKDIMKDVVELRNQYFPECNISVLSNSSMLHSKSVREGLLLADRAIMKLDGGTEELYQQMNRPLKKRSLGQIVEYLESFDGNLEIQTLFTRGIFRGRYLDNTAKYAVDRWLDLLKRIRPRRVMLYSIDRPTPAIALEKISAQEMEQVAMRVMGEGIAVQVR